MVKNYQDQSKLYVDDSDIAIRDKDGCLIHNQDAYNCLSIQDIHNLRSSMVVQILFTITSHLVPLIINHIVSFWFEDDVESCWNGVIEWRFQPSTVFRDYFRQMRCPNRLVPVISCICIFWRFKESGDDKLQSKYNKNLISTFIYPVGWMKHITAIIRSS